MNSIDIALDALKEVMWAALYTVVFAAIIILGIIVCRFMYRKLSAWVFANELTTRDKLAASEKTNNLLLKENRELRTALAEANDYIAVHKEKQWAESIRKANRNGKSIYTMPPETKKRP